MREKIELSQRLLAAAEFIPAGESVVDVGTDHAYLPISVLMSGRCKHAVASDIRIGPLKAARRNVEAFHLEEKIELRLSDGLDAFRPEELSCVVIAGMGGHLMEEMIRRSYGEGKLKDCENMILQPQSEIHRVRRALHGAAMRICREKMVQDRGKYYTVLLACPGSESYLPEEYYYGRKLFESRDQVFYQFLQEETAQKRRIVSRLTLGASSEAVKNRVGELSLLIHQGERMLEEWDVQ